MDTLQLLLILSAVITVIPTTTWLVGRTVTTKVRLGHELAVMQLQEQLKLNAQIIRERDMRLMDPGLAALPPVELKEGAVVEEECRMPVTREQVRQLLEQQAQDRDDGELYRRRPEGQPYPRHH